MSIFRKLMVASKGGVEGHPYCTPSPPRFPPGLPLADSGGRWAGDGQWGRQVGSPVRQLVNPDHQTQQGKNCLNPRLSLNKDFVITWRLVPSLRFYAQILPRMARFESRCQHIRERWETSCTEGASLVRPDLRGRPVI